MHGLVLPLMGGFVEPPKSGSESLQVGCQLAKPTLKVTSSTLGGRGWADWGLGLGAGGFVELPKVAPNPHESVVNSQNLPSIDLLHFGGHELGWAGWAGLG